MKLFDPNERAFAKAVSKLTYCNPFLEERIAFEREAFGPDFSEARAVWNLSPDRVTHQPNVTAILERVEGLLEKLSGMLKEPGPAMPGAQTLDLYEDLVIFLLYYSYLNRFLETSQAYFDGKEGGKRIHFYQDFLEDARRYLMPGKCRLPAADEIPHLFACFFQVRRAFLHIFTHILGLSAPAVRLRAAAWQSIFTHDMRRYRRTLYHRMGNITTLITGPSGTGKELVARAI
ncbi:MAG: sigma-54-dependent Fis family transcriptional regulator, partial [Planctomycetes bacterium]|nr:sigma-54-dependent Fis family transcriptional regulator [Planctomycetota bacterium]